MMTLPSHSQQPCFWMFLSPSLRWPPKASLRLPQEVINFLSPTNLPPINTQPLTAALLVDASCPFSQMAS